MSPISHLVKIARLVTRHSAVIPTTVQLPPAWRARFLRMAAWLLAAIIAIHTFSLPVLRLSNLAHFHMAATSGDMRTDNDDDWDHGAAGGKQPIVARHEGGVHEHDHGNGDRNAHSHRHAHIEDHDHGVARDDVVYIATDDAGPLAGHSAKRTSFDLDGMMSYRISAIAVAATEPEFASLKVNFRSRDELPLERPPRVRA